MSSMTRQELEQELFELRETLAAAIDVLGDDTLTPAEKVREIRDVVGAEFDELDDDGAEEG